MSEGVDITAAGRIFGHHHTIIIRWIEHCGRHSERLHERLFHRALFIGQLQLYELVTKGEQDAERVWFWTAVVAQSKLILALHIGRRSFVDPHQLLHQVWQRLNPDLLPIFASDGLNQYFYAINAHFGFWHKPLRARKHHWFPDVRLQYAQLCKRRRGWRVSFLHSFIRPGIRQLIRPELKALSMTGEVQTAFVER